MPNKQTIITNDGYFKYTQKYPDPLRSRWVNPHQTNYSKQERLYSFSEYFVHGGQEDILGCNAFYSDRARSWWGEKITEARPLVIEKFGKNGGGGLKWLLKAWEMLYNLCAEKPMVLTAMAEGCNVSNGYPYFIFWYYNQEDRDEFDAVWAKLQREGLIRSNRSIAYSHLWGEWRKQRLTLQRENITLEDFLRQQLKEKNDK